MELTQVKITNELSYAEHITKVDDTVESFTQALEGTNWSDFQNAQG